MCGRELRDEAAGWFSLCRSGDMTAADRIAFDAWMGASPAARAAYRHVEWSWELVGGLADEPEIVASRDREARRYGRPAPWHGYAAALTAIAAAMLLTISPPTLLRDGFASWRTAGGGQIIATGPDQRSTTTLADGSVVTLDVASRLRVVEMGARRKLELLSGHAFFRVAKDAVHPFLVQAIDKTVHAVGTAFDVRIDGDAVAVTLVEGKVRVDQPRSLFRAPVVADMVPGHRLVAAPDREWRETSVDTSRATAWLDDKLVYLPGSLGKVVADVNAGSTRKIMFVGSFDADRKVIGVFGRGDVDAVATALELSSIAHVVHRREDRIEMMQDGVSNVNHTDKSLFRANSDQSGS